MLTNEERKERDEYYTYEKCEEIASDYKSKTAFKTANWMVYNIADRKGWIDKLFDKKNPYLRSNREEIEFKITMYSYKYFRGKLRVNFLSDLDNKDHEIIIKLDEPFTILEYVNKNLQHNTSDFPKSTLEAFKMTLESDMRCGLSLEIKTDKVTLEDILND